ncbi:MAG: RNA methyltransferase [Clostridia bacterium]|nr:RNA methyltransferase [Clostridia bacterium]
MEKITSRKSSIIKTASELLDSASARAERRQYMAEGARLVEDASLSGVDISELFYTEKAYGKYKKYIDKAAEKSEKIYIIEEHVASLLSSTKSSQGVFAVCKWGKNIRSSSLLGKVITFENIQDPNNMGNMLRTAEALGIKTVLLVGACCDITSPKVLRGSMGAVYRLNFIKLETPEELHAMLVKDGVKLYGAVPSDKALKITEMSFDDKTTVAIGNEGNGLTEEFKSVCDNLVTIPMLGRAESLNAATASAIIMWEMTK